MPHQPDLTVAAVVERSGRFLLVEERVGRRMVFNQPAGHVECNEHLLAAVIRETLEETAWTFQPEALLGIYLWDHPEKKRSFLRFSFRGQVTTHDPARPLDRGIKRAVWMDRSAIVAQSARLRSPMVLKCIDDYVQGRSYPLELIRQMQRETVTAELADQPFARGALPLIERLT